jgi:two-component system chemotaxis sensor kinase CheA
MSEFQVSRELLNIYLEDARGHLDALDQCLLALERSGFDRERIAAVLGPLHTLKGNSGMIGFVAIKDYVHRLEDVIAEIETEKLPLDSRALDPLFAGATALRDAIEKAGASGTESRDLVPERRSLEGLISDAAASLAAETLPGARAPAARPAGEPSGGAAAAQATRSETGQAVPSSQYVAVRSSTVRVDFAQLDDLLNLVGELIIYRTKLQQLGRQLGEELESRTSGRELIEAIQQVAGVSGQLQETVMDVRMLPIGHVFDRFPRMVRDLARAQGKEIEFIVEGEGTRVDKAIIDEIGEPLVHLMRNSIDHGIEDPGQRLAAGKTRTGTILLSASQESNHVVITLMDDGAGVDAGQVRKKAIEMGLLRSDQTLSDREVVQLIFHQGFSTSESITEVSGRGVGLDVVLKSIERLNGLVEVETLPGIGSKFIIQLPLTLAIISVLLVEAGTQVYAIPLSSVIESIKLVGSDVHQINGRDTIRLRDRIVPLTHLRELFSLPGETRSSHYAVILGRGEKRLGLVVDRLRGQQEVVIKGLDAVVSGAAVGLAGATIMGDGRVVLILDVATLFEGKRHGAVRAVTGPAAVEA